MAKSFLLSEQDQAALRELLSQWKGQLVNYPHRGRQEEEFWQTPEVYVCLTPPDGIPGLADPVPATGTGPGSAQEQPGQADCEVFRILPDNDGVDSLFPSSVGTLESINNLSTSAVSGDEWIIAVRDKHGDLYVVGALGGSSGSDTTWVKILCITPSGISGYYPGLDLDFNVTTQAYDEADGSFLTVTSPSFSSGTDEVAVDDLTGINIGDVLMALDGLCNCESIIVTDVDITGTGTDPGTGSPPAGFLTAAFLLSYVANGVLSITITNPGSGYASTPPTVNITDVHGNVSATATAVLDNTGDFVSDILFASRGKDYDPANTTITFSDPDSGMTATGIVVLSGPIKLYKSAKWIWFNPSEFVPVQNDVNEPVVYFARIEGNFTDGIGVRVALGGVTLVASCSGGGSLVWYAGRLVTSP